jgi:peptidylprolyl isomerase
LFGAVFLSASCSGIAAAKSGDKVKVDYTLKLSDGTVFDTSVGKTPLEFTLGQNQVIVGFEKAVIGMKVGESKTVIIPAAEAYGATPNANNPLAGKNLTFEIKLLQIVK